MVILLRTSSICNTAAERENEEEIDSNDRNQSRTEHRKNQESRCRGTRTLPYASWDGECQSERASALRENAFWSCVFDSSRQRYSRHSEMEWENDRERVSEWRNFWGGPKVDKRVQWNCGRETEVFTSTDRISKSLSKWSPLKGKSCHQARRKWFFYSTGQFFKEIAISRRKTSIWNDDESTTIRVNVRLQRTSEKQRTDSVN